MPFEDAPIQLATKAQCRRAVMVSMLLVASALAACGDRRDLSGQAPSRGAPEGEAAYRPPPEATFSQRLASGVIVVGGTADPSADFSNAMGSVTFAPNEATGSLSFPLVQEVRPSFKLF